MAVKISIRYLSSKYRNREKEACQKMYAVNTFGAARAAKKYKDLVAYVEYFNPKGNQMDSTAIDSFIAQYPTAEAMDLQFYEIAIEQRDSNYIKWRKGYKASKEALLAMYKVNSLQEVRAIQFAEHLENNREYYEARMLALGVNSVEEAFYAQQELLQKQADWDKQVGYVFKTANLGNWINCDYFPGKTTAPLVTQNFELPVSPKATTTYLIFKDIASVMSGSPNYYDLGNYYTFNNIPKGKSVQVVSFYLDVEGNTHVATKTVLADEKACKLDYQVMSIDELKAVLTQLDV